MRIDPAQSVEKEISDLRDQVECLRKECKAYFRIIEDLRSRREGWKHSTLR